MMARWASGRALLKPEGLRKSKHPQGTPRKSTVGPSPFRKLLEGLKKNVCPCAGKGGGDNRTPCPGLLGGPFCQTCPRRRVPLICRSQLDRQRKPIFQRLL